MFRNRMNRLVARTILGTLALAIMAPTAQAASSQTRTKGTFAVRAHTVGFAIGIKLPAPSPDVDVSGIQSFSTGPFDFSIGHFHHYVDISGSPFRLHDGSFAFLAKRGDLLMGTFHGVITVPGVDGVAHIRDVLTFQGGTGRFVGATGWANMTGQVVTDQTGKIEPAFLDITGAVTLPERRRQAVPLFDFVTLPIIAASTGTAEVTSAAGAPSIEVTGEQTFTDPALGFRRATFRHVVNTTTDPVIIQDGVLTLHDKDGDQLNATYLRRPDAPLPEGVGIPSEFVRFFGGTGKFERATGVGFLHGLRPTTADETVNPAGPQNLAYVGVVTIPKPAKLPPTELEQ